MHVHLITPRGTTPLTNRYTCVMNVNEASEALGVSPRRVRAMISQGTIPAQMVKGRWQLQDYNPRTQRSRRPLSPSSRTALVDTLRTRSLGTLTAQTRARTADRLRALRDTSDPASLIASWWPEGDEGGDPFTRSLVRNARAGNNAYLTKLVKPRANEYLRSRERLADILKTERAVRGLSVLELADASGVQSKIISHLEKGLRVSSPAAALRTLAVVGVQPTALPDLEMK